MQARLIGWLRWRILVNSLRTGRAQIDLFAKILVGILVAVVALAIGIGAGALGFALVKSGRAVHLVYVCWGLFFLWQFFSVIAAATTAEFDFRSLLRYPLRFSTFTAMSLLYGLFDPAALAALAGITCLGIGIGLARADLLLPVAAVLGAFAVANLILNRLLMVWLERILARRRGREAVMMLVVLLMVGVQLLVAAAERWGPQAGPWVSGLVYASYLLPPGLAGLALDCAARGETSAVTGLVFGLLAYAAIFAVWLRRRLRAFFAGEDLSEALAPRAPAEKGRVAAGWTLPGVPGAVGAIFEKELRYFFRIGPLMLSLLLPPLIIGLFALLAKGPKNLPKFLEETPDLLFPSAVAYLFLTLSPHAFNSFSYDRHGVQLLLAAPVRFRDVLLGKNLAYAALFVLESMLLGTALALLGRPPGAAMVAATFLALVFAMLVDFTAGNWLSLRFPRAMNLEKFRGQQAGVTMVVSLVLQVVVFGLAGFVFFLAVVFQSIEAAAVAFLALAALALPPYLWMLGRADQLAAENREVLTAELCK
jgi:ABC-2 type transport system permease protein